MDYCGNCINYKKVNEKKGRCRALKNSFYITPKSCLGCQNFRTINKEKIFNSSFDAGLHAIAFDHYLKVVITPDGVVHYAIPSHTAFAIWWAKTFLKINPKNLEDTGCILVWENVKIGPKPNDEQKKTLKDLQKKDYI